jgi:hypothetical protein
VADVVATAADNAEICLDAGDYGTVDFFDIARTAFVTVRSTSGIDASMSPQIGASHFIKFQSLTIQGALINSCSSNVQLLDSTFTEGLLVNNRDSSCPANLNLVVDGNTFGDLGPALFEGRLSVADNDSGTQPMGLTISNNTFGPGCQSDGIQLVGGAGGVTIGPGNVFDGIEQSGPVHCDMIQFYSGGPPSTIDGNWFKNGSVVITHHTAAPGGTVFTNNLITNVAQLQIGQSADVVFEHNTIVDLTDVFQINSGSTNASIRSNILIGNTAGLDTNANGGCTGCTISHELCETADQCSGTDTIIGVPTFLGGAMPSAWSGWELADGSLGENTGHDGLDRGITYVPDTGGGGASTAGAGGMPPATSGSGASGSGAASGAPSTDPESSGCACRILPRRHGGTEFFYFLLLITAAARRRRTRQEAK